MSEDVDSHQDVLDNQIQNGTSTSKCPSCGANLEWSPVDKCLKCAHCDTAVTVAMDRFGEELDFATMLEDNNGWGDETHVFRCKNCGAREVISKSEISKMCSFCGATNVVETDEICGIRPNAVVPFNLDKETAGSNFKKWAKHKLFAPRAYKKTVKADEINGNYTPAFTFDTDTFSRYSGRLGKYYYVTVRRDGKDVRERRVEYFNISGEYRDAFDDIVVVASDRISERDFSKLQSFNTNSSHEYSENFMYGYRASQYTKDGKTCWTEARGRISAILKQRILAQYTYDFVDTFNYNTSCSNIKYKYMLLPVYVGHSVWHKKLYNFYVNGRSGVVHGKSPVSFLKVGLLVGIIAAVVAVVGVCIYFFGGF